jgi:poly-beta-hydroxyalkanoate depolymerase
MGIYNQMKKLSFVCSSLGKYLRRHFLQTIMSHNGIFKQQNMKRIEIVIDNEFRKDRKKNRYMIER